MQSGFYLPALSNYSSKATCMVLAASAFHFPDSLLVNMPDGRKHAISLSFVGTEQSSKQGLLRCLQFCLSVDRHPLLL